MDKIAQRLISLGWQPLGGVAVTYAADSLEVVYAQAFVKYEEPDAQP